MFRDRADAGERLAEVLEPYKAENPVVLAIPRGGVEVAFHVARRLDAELAALVVRKLPLPYNPEAGFGAIAEDGSTFIFEEIAESLPATVVEKIIQEQKKEIQRRVEALRRGAPLPQIRGRTAIVVDDGIAMGSTVRAGVALCRNQEAAKIIVAAPVAGSATADELTRIADTVIILEKPPLFRAVAQVYKDWYDVPDEEVVALLDEFAAQRT